MGPPQTAAAINDLERGKVQVSAVDLYKIATLLEKPVQFFYRDTLLPEGSEDFLLEAQKVKHGSIKEMMVNFRLAYKMGELVAEFTEKYEKGEIISSEDTQRFYEILITYFADIENCMNMALEIKREIDQGIKIPKLDDPNKSLI